MILPFVFSEIYFTKEYKINNQNYSLWLYPLKNESLICINNHNCTYIILSKNSQHNIIKNELWKQHTDYIKSLPKKWSLELLSQCYNDSIAVYNDEIHRWIK